MREIKFRAWDEGGPVMLSHEDIDRSDKDGVLMWGEIFNGKEKDIHLMQFTGLRDKNGKEIYEGDVVKDGAGQVNVITFGAGTYWFNWLHLVDVMEPVEVIGNIYENPELPEVSA